MNREQFINSNKAELEKDRDIQQYLNNAKNEEERKSLVKGLEDSLGKAYTSYVKEYEESKGWGSWLLRGAGHVASGIGTYTFLLDGGLGFKGLGVLLGGGSEAIDNRRYEQFKDNSLEGITKDGVKLASESLASTLLSYAPFGELWRLKRGESKYDAAIVRRALYHAKNEFIKQFGEYDADRPKIISIDKFVDPAYRDDDKIIRIPEYGHEYKEAA